MSAITERKAVAKGNDGRFSTFITGDLVRKKINEMIGSKKGDSFVTAMVASVSTNPSLAECDHTTILSAGMQGAALDLSPSPSLGQFYMVPYNDNKNNRKVAQFQIGYKGYIQLAIRSGQYRHINVVAIKEGELISYNRLTEELFTKLIEDDDIREATPAIGYYTMFELMNGFVKTMYWSKEKMERHTDKYSNAFKLTVFKDLEAGKIPQKDLWKSEYSSYWYKDFEGMSFKTMLRQILSKWGVMSVEMQKAFESDMGVLDDNGSVTYIDNMDDVVTSAVNQESDQISMPSGKQASEKPAPDTKKKPDQPPSDGKATAGEIAYLKKKCESLGLKLEDVAKEAGITDIASLTADGFIAIKEILTQKEQG